MGNSAASFKEVFQRNEHPTSESESPVCAPVQNLTDPRSPTDQFNRTPIEVAGLPIKIRSRMNSAHMRQSLGPTARGSYLKSDDISDSPNVEKPTRMLRKLCILSDDPRSPSAGIIRTPIQVESTHDDVYRSTEDKSTARDCLVTDTSPEDLVFLLSDFPATSGNKPKFGLLDPTASSASEESAQAPNQLEYPTDSLTQQAVDASVTSQTGDSETNSTTEEQEEVTNSRKPVAGRVTPMKLNKTSEDRLIRKLFSGPDPKEHLMHTSSKARTPLQSMSANGITSQRILRVKQSCGINQEIERLSGIENTPPDTFNRSDTPTKNKQLQIYSMTSGWESDSTSVH